MIPYDFIAEKNALDEQHEFIRKIVDAKPDIVLFIDNCLGWNGSGEFLNYFKGSFNLSLAVRNKETSERVLIRFPFPGNVYGPWRDRKVKNEVMILNYLSEKTSIPIPRVLRWGLTERSPLQLGPFMIEEFLEGEDLGDVLKKPTESETDPSVLDPEIDEEKLDFVYEQIAGFMVELSRLEFTHIGAITKDTVSGEWIVAEPPLTFDMNEVVTCAGFSADHFRTMPMFDCSSDYFAARAKTLKAHLEAHRNVAFEDGDITWNRYVARQYIEKLIPKYATEDSGPFRLFCDDLRPSNMLVNPKTMRITALLDFEFTNTMPAQYTYDVPWWLILRPPAIVLSEEGKEKFLYLFEPRKDQFIRAMERVEARSALPAEEPRFSSRIRESWDSKRFWFNLAIRSSFDVDEIYWEFLHTEGQGESSLVAATLKSKEAFLKRKKDQFDAYFVEKKNDERFDS